MERFILVDEPKAPQYKLVCFEIGKALLITPFVIAVDQNL
jgi:hypothetical protein